MNKKLSWLIAAAFSTTAWAQGGMAQAPAYPEAGAVPGYAQQEYPELPLPSEPAAHPDQFPSYPGSQSSGSSMDKNTPAEMPGQRGLDSRSMQGQPALGTHHGSQQDKQHGKEGEGHGKRGVPGSSDSGMKQERPSHAGERSPAPAPMGALTPVSQSGFTYLCGGIGSDEAAQMKQSARDYDLMLTFASGKGNYLADIDVDISGKGDASLQATCDAPIMLVDFPKGGSYRIKATANGKTLTRNTSVKSGKGHKALVMVWPEVAAARMKP